MWFWPYLPWVKDDVTTLRSDRCYRRIVHYCCTYFTFYILFTSILCFIFVFQEKSKESWHSINHAEFCQNSTWIAQNSGKRTIMSKGIQHLQNKRVKCGILRFGFLLSIYGRFRTYIRMTTGSRCCKRLQRRYNYWSHPSQTNSNALSAILPALWQNVTRRSCAC